MSMQDKTVIITGGSRGMGQRLALKLGAEKANVVVNYRRDDEAAKDTVAQIEALGGTAPRRPGRRRRDRVGRVARRPVGRALRQPRRRRRQRGGERVQAALADLRASHREDHEPHGPGLPRPGPALDAAHERRRPRHGRLGLGQLPGPSRARAARRRQGRDGDARQVPRDRAGRRTRSPRSASARARSTPTPSATTPATPGRTTRSSGWPRRRRVPTRRPTRSRTSWPTSSRRRARRSTARRSWSTAGCRSRRCRSASDRTERDELVLGGRTDGRPAHAPGRAPACSRHRGRGGRWRPQADHRRLGRGLQPAGQRLRGPRAGTRRPCRLRRPESPRVRRAGVRTPEGGPRQGPAEPSLHTRTSCGDASSSPTCASSWPTSTPRPAIDEVFADDGPLRTRDRRARRVDVVRRPGRRAVRRRRSASPSDPTTCTTSGSAPARPESRRASRSPTAEPARPCSATPGS